MLHQKGFGFIELFIVVGVIAGVTATLITINKQPANIKQDRQWLQVAEQKVVSFAALEGRLPCPDTTGDGHENCGAEVKGYLPYLTLDSIGISDYQVPAGMVMKLQGMDIGDTKLAYGVYVKPKSDIVKKSISIYNIDNLAIPLMPEDADLTSATVDRYTPLMVLGKRVDACGTDKPDYYCTCPTFDPFHYDIAVVQKPCIETIEIPTPYTNKKQDLSDSFDFSDLFNLDFTDIIFTDYSFKVVNSSGNFIGSDKGSEADYIHLHNSLDLCAALANADRHSLSSDFLHSEVPASRAVSGVSQKNIAFAIAYPGVKDADNNNLSISNAVSDLFDKLNRNSTTAFNASTSISNDYDDVVLTKSFAVLSQDLKCNSVINSMNLMATSFQSRFEVDNKAGAAKQSALMGAIEAGFGTLLNIVTGIQAAVALVTAVGTLSASVAALLGAIMGCLFLAGCGAIPGFVSAVVLSATGVVLSGVAVAAVIAAVISQAVATGLYIDISIRSAAATEISGVDYSGLIGSIEEKLVDTKGEKEVAWDRWQDADEDATTALNSADARFDASAAYGRDNYNPINTQDPDYIVRMNDARDEIDISRTKQREYYDTQAIYDAQFEICEQSPSAASCDTLRIKTINATIALAEWEGQIVNAKNSYQAAYDSAMNFLVYSPAKDGADAYETRCGDISDCKLKDGGEFSLRDALGDPARPKEIKLYFDSFENQYRIDNSSLSSNEIEAMIINGEVAFDDGNDWVLFTNLFGASPPTEATLLQIEGSYLDYSDKKIIAETTENEYNVKSDAVTELEIAVASMTCMQADAAAAPPIPSGIYDVATGQCDRSGAGTNPQEIPFENNVENTLLRADDKGIAQ